MSTAGKRGPGRPSKGVRKQRMLRYPFWLDEALAKAAEDCDSEDVQALMIEILAEDMRKRGYLPRGHDEGGYGHLLSA